MSRRPARRRSKLGPWIALAIVIGLVAASGHKAAAAPVKATTGAARHHHGGKTAGERAVAWAEAQQGKPYVYGADSYVPGGQVPDSFDCSSLTQSAWAAAGVTIPRESEDQWSGLRHVPMRHLKPGDLILYTGSPIDPPPGHVIMFIGNNQIIQAYATGYPVAISTGIPPGAWGAVRP